jgi:hypothetical protein
LTIPPVGRLIKDIHVACAITPFFWEADMATPARVRLYSSAIPVGVWSGLVLVALAVAIVWALPQARTLVGAGIAAGILLAGVLLILRQRSRHGGDSPAAPLHLRD